MTKKILILVAMMLAATTLFAETVTCESKMGKCTYEITSNGTYLEDCTCRDGNYSRVGGSDLQPLPSEEECYARLDTECKDAGFKCENEAGECVIAQNGEYICQCLGVWSANGAVEGMFKGTMEFNEETSEKENCDKLVEICGTEPATVRDVCEDQEILNECITYIKPVNTCYGRQWPDEDIEAILDHQAYNPGTVYDKISDCCQWGEENDLKEWRTKWECLDNCTDEDCCQTCGFYFDEGVVSSEEGSAEDADAANTEVPTDGATPEDTADGDSSAPATDSEAPAENKEESKSDGCSMLFI